MPRLYAIGDLHLSFPVNRIAWAELRPQLDDGLILCGDIAEKPEHIELAFSIATKCFKEVFWCPGNHELYTLNVPTDPQLRGEAKYKQCVDIARKYGVHTPEDEFVMWQGEGGPVLVAPIFTLYDYSFRPDNIATTAEALKWAEEMDTVATDEFILHPDPHPSREAWCEDLVERTKEKLDMSMNRGLPLVIVNHWPLREDLIWIPRVPRFTLWCGTKKTEDWHIRFNAKAVVSGHLHVRRTDWKDGVRFEECSLGYPRQWEMARSSGKDINQMLREILPGPTKPESDHVPTHWRMMG